jgi:cytochrome c
MRKVGLLLVSAFSLSAVASPAFAAATADQAKAMSEKAAAHIKAVGEAKAFEDFTNGTAFKDGELYVFCYRPDGTNVAHGGNAKLVGKNLIDVKDPDGKRANYEIIQMGETKGQGWVDFKWVNPVTSKIEPKSAYVVKTGGVTCGVGYYK